MPYKLPPIIFLTTEQDGSVYDCLSRNIDNLFSRGYRTICIEWPKDSSVSKLLKCSQGARDRAEKAQEFILHAQLHDNKRAELAAGFSDTAPFYQSAANFYEKLSSMAGVKKIFCDVEEKYLSNPKLSLQELKPKREESMADAITQAAKDSEGGVIAILGTNHDSVYNLIKQKDSDNAHTYLFIALNAYFDIVFPPHVSEGERKRALEERHADYLKKLTVRAERARGIIPKGSFFSFSCSDSQESSFADKLVFEVLRRRTELLQSPPEVEPVAVSRMKK